MHHFDTVNNLHRYVQDWARTDSKHVSRQCSLSFRPVNLASPKPLRLGSLVGVAPIESLTSHTHCRKIDDFDSESASILACVACTNCVYTVFCSLRHAVPKIYHCSSHLSLKEIISGVIPCDTDMQKMTSCSHIVSICSAAIH